MTNQEWIDEINEWLKQAMEGVSPPPEPLYYKVGKWLINNMLGVLAISLTVLTCLEILSIVLCACGFISIGLPMAIVIGITLFLVSSGLVGHYTE